MSSLFRALLDAYLPKRCGVCHRANTRNLVCRGCRPADEIDSSVKRCSWCWSSYVELSSTNVRDGPNKHECAQCRAGYRPPYSMHYMWDYSGKARELIVAMKYQPHAEIADWSAKLLIESIGSCLREENGSPVVIPIPSTPRNYAARLFSPSERIAASVAKVFGYQLITGALIHRDFLPSQSSLDETERKRNARGSLLFSGKLDTEHVILIDDVVTTGSTLDSATHLLKLSGVKKITAWCIARNPRWRAQYKG
jgi:ComF family protein